MLQSLLQPKVEVQRQKAIQEWAAGAGDGVLRRIDENRALLELLQLHYPELLNEHPSVELCLGSHEEFFSELAKVTQVKQPVNVMRGNE